MLCANLRIRFPWLRTRLHRDLLYRHWNLSAHKNAEVQFTRLGGTEHFVNVLVDLDWGGSDHAGPRLEITVLHWFLSLSVYDNRHWNYERKRWMTDAEAQVEFAQLDSATSQGLV